MGAAGKASATMDLADHGKPVETPAIPAGAEAPAPNTVGGPLPG